MIIWINGPYGIGKSALTAALQNHLQESFIFDAERLGDAIRENMPESFFRETFEEYPLWQETCQSLLKALSQDYSGHVLIPMTLIRPDSVTAIVDRLKAQQVDIAHVMLEASHETIRQRILTRGEEEDCWCMAQIDRCLAAQREMTCDQRLWTDGKNPEELARELGGRLGIPR